MSIDTNTKFDPRFQTEEIGFDAADLTACDKCGRRNPPNRAACMYCGADLVIRPEFLSQVKLTAVAPETDESGINIIVTAGDVVRYLAAGGSQESIGIDLANVDRLTDSRARFPIARVATEREATAVVTRLEQTDLKTVNVSDEALNAAEPPVRVAAIVFGEGKLTMITFNTGETTQFDINELTCVVGGSLSRSRTDMVEKRGRGGKTKKVIDETATESDEAILDLYFRGHDRGFRIQVTGFDFSCLGPDKSMLAAANIKHLSEKLRSISEKVTYVGEYGILRFAIEESWPLGSKIDAKGLVRSGFARKDFGKIATLDNILQMNKFSRLQALEK